MEYFAMLPFYEGGLDDLKHWTQSKMFLLGWFVILFIPTLTWADTTATPSFPLSEAIQLALKHDYQVISASNDLEKAKLAVKAEMLKYFPQATLETSYGYQFERKDYPSNIVISVKDSIPTKWNLYGNKPATDLQAALWDQMNYEAAYQIAQATVIYNTTVQYITVLKDQKAIEIQEAILKNSQASADLAIKQLKVGQITKPDQLKTESSLATAKFNLEKSKQDLYIAIRQLENETGQADLSQAKLSEPKELQAPADLDYLPFKNEAVQRRLEPQQAQISIKKAEQSLATAKNQMLPALNLNYINSSDINNYSIGYNLLTGVFSWSASHQQKSNRQGILSNVDNNNLFTQKSGISLKLSWTFDFGLARNAAMQAELSLNSAKANQDKIKQDVLLDADQAISSYKLASLQTFTNREAVPFYQKTLEVKQLQLKLGSATPLDVATAQNDLSQAQVDVLKAEYDQMSAYQKLLQSAGRLYPFNQTPGSSGGTKK